MEAFDFFAQSVSVPDDAWLQDVPMASSAHLPPAHSSSFTDSSPMIHTDHMQQSSHGQQTYGFMQPTSQMHVPHPQSFEQPSFMGNSSLQEQQIQLEALRETRKIREIELQIAEEKRHESEARRKEREADVALTEAQVRLRSMQMSRASTPASEPTRSRRSPPQDLSGRSLQPSPPEIHYSPVSTSSPSDADRSDSSKWLEPSMQDFLQGYYVPEVPSLLPYPPSPNAPSSSSPSRSDAPGPSTQLTQLSRSNAAQKARRTQVSTSRKKGTTRILDECDAFCAQCNRFMARLLLRGSQEELDVNYETYYKCSACAPVGTGASTRKRANETEDTESVTICDVCNRIQGYGGFTPKDSRVVLSFAVEVVCASCSDKYRRDVRFSRLENSKLTNLIYRCTNCGGGSSRGGIGKWRCKELFEDDRKTCGLSHARLGGRDMELAVWEIPIELPGRKELPALIEAIESLWREHVVSKMGVPEVLEYQSLRTYADIEEKILNSKFPGRNMYENLQIVPGRHLYTALTWAKVRARRDKSKPHWAQSKPQDKSIDEWVAYNTRRSNVLYPANSILCGAWIAEWSVQDRTLLMDTLCMFDYLDVEDRSAFSFEELLHRILYQIRDHNNESPEDPWHAPEHLWAAIKANPYSLRMRLVETLERRLGFVPLEEYLTRYPCARREMFSPEASQLASAVDSRPSVDGRGLTILVKYLGTSQTIESLEKKKRARLAKRHRAEAKFDE